MRKEQNLSRISERRNKFKENDYTSLPFALDESKTIQ